MPALAAFDYVVVRIVPRVEREEFVNVGVVLFCRTRRFLDARVRLDRARLAALAPDLDADEVAACLDGIPAICGGVGPIGKLSLAERFHWLAAPRSTVVQVSPVHSGLCADPRETLTRLVESLASDSSPSAMPSPIAAVQ